MNNYNKTNEDYRRVLSTANKLETIQSNLESVIDFFIAPLVKLYTKLCNDCLKLLFESEFKLDQFRKAEELVWKRIYHAVYRFQKTERQHIKRHDEYLVESHFISGIGFYSTLIVKLRSHYKIYDVPGIIKPLGLTLGPLDNFLESGVDRINDSHNIRETNDDNSSKAKEWARQAIYRSLVYMGDLARYLHESSQCNYHKLAFELYRAASRNQPDQGLPFNQLATLAGGVNHNLDAVCNYMRCCLRPKPFEGAEGNMRKIFELNKKFQDELNKQERISTISEVLSSMDPSKAAESMIQMIIINFIKLTSDLWTAISNNGEHIEKDKIDNETQVFFQSLREALELEPIVPLTTLNDSDQEFCPITGESSHSNRPKYISPTIMYEFCSISIMLIAKCQRQKFPESIKQLPDYIEDLVNTLALNLLHYSTSKCQKMIIKKLQELRMNRQNLIGDRRTDNKNLLERSFTNSRGNLSNSSHKSGDTINSTPDATSRRAMSRLRKRKAATNYSDNAIRTKPSVIHTEDSDMSELEETAFSTIDALEISSDMSDEADHQIDDLIDLDSSSDDILIPKHNNSRLHVSGDFSSSKRRFLRPTKSQNYESERSLNLANSSNSLPVPDLLTGSLDDKINFINLPTSQSPTDSPNDSESHERSSLSAFGKDVSRSINDISDPETVMAFIYTQTYLPTIKILSDWLLSNSEVISSNLQSFRAFCIDLSELVSLLRDLRRMLESKDENLVSITSDEDLCSENDDTQCSSDSAIDKHVYDGPAWIQKYPLSCDFPLFNLPALKNVHELNIDFDYRKDLSDSESGFITIQCIEAFSHALTVFLENKTSLGL